MPKPTEAIPKVIMKGETLKTETPMPLTTPMAVPARKPASTPSTIASKALSGTAANTPAMTVADTIEVTANIVPTERSKPPVSRANICPMATMVR
jgi:hypothetical protein